MLVLPSTKRFPGSGFRLISPLPTGVLVAMAIGVASLPCQPAAGQTPQPPVPQPPIDQPLGTTGQPVRLLNPGAQIHITVVGAPDLTGDYTVDAAGDIQMLYIKQAHVADLTAAQAAAELASKQYLGKYYRVPQVLVTLVSIGGISVQVTGAVATQGPRVLRPDAGLNELLQLASPAVDADLTKVRVTHGLPGATHTTDTVDYLSFLNNQDSTGNPGLHDGDTVFVPRKEDVQIMVSIRGEVAKPGRAAVPAKTTVYDAVQTAGGLLPDADRTGIVLERAGTGDQVPFDYEAATKQPDSTHVNPILMDGDAIVVKAADISNVYTITGAVLKPGSYPLTAKHVTLADAIGQAGGTTDRPVMKSLTIFRKTADGHSRPLTLDASSPTIQGSTDLQPGDIITIPQGKEGFHVNPLQTLGVVGTLYGIFGRR